MGQENYSLHVILFSLLLLFIPCSMAKTASNFTISPSCESHCGIPIPYPFGIGKGCFLNKWYEILCNTSWGKRVPFLRKLNREVVEIPLPNQYGSYGPIRIKNRITSLGCSGGAEPPQHFNLTGSPFYLQGQTNSLVTVGCNIKASTTQVKREFIGCESNCDKTNARGEQSETCNGYKCCKVIISSSLQVAGVAVESADPNSSEEGCRVAFLTDETNSPSNIQPEAFYAKGYANITLEWHFDTSAPLFVNSSECRNTTDSKDSRKGNCEFYDRYLYGPSYRDYECAAYYTGNPYLPGGCKGVDACLTNKCGKGYTCKNIPGDFLCVKNRPNWTILGLSLGVGLLILIIVLWWLYKFMRKRKEINCKKKFFRRHGGLLLQQQLTAVEGGNIDKTRIFNSKELEKATDKFNENRILGKGGQGTVYKGMLEDGTIVAVKISTKIDKDKDDPEGFINEIIILSQINHKNVVKLLGCCLETEVPVLVYEFIPNGNLSEHLYEQVEDYSMTWKIRLRIAIETAGALAYLHSSILHPIYHRDIKSTNILLDKKYRVKVSDFGISRSVTVEHTHLTTQVAGTFGYMDPEYLRSSQYTDKSDVYSFGVVLVELLTGEKPVPSKSKEDGMNLAAHFVLAMKQNKLSDIIDSRVKEDCEPEEVMAVANLAKRCLSLNPKKRPNMREVSMELERIRSSSKDSKVQIENDEEYDEATAINIGDSWNIAHYTASASDMAASLSIDVEPTVFPQTW